MSEKIDKAEKEFHDEFDILIEKWINNENLPMETLIYRFINEAKINACFYHGCYLHMLGHLTSMLNENLKEMYDEISNARNKIEEEK
jgi:hypothetical protein